MLNQLTKKACTGRDMSKYEPVSARAWNIIMDEVKRLHHKEDVSMDTLGKMLGVRRDAVWRWLKADMGGERTTFSAMIRYAKVLGIPYSKLVEDPKQSVAVTPFSKALGKTLNEFAQDNELTLTDIAKQANMPATEVNTILAGETQITAEQLHHLCKAIEVKATIVLNRTEKTIEKDSAAIADRSA